MRERSQLVPSAYNVAQLSRTGRRYVLFNTVSTALLSVGPSDFELLEDVFPSPLLEDRPVRAPMAPQAEDRLARPIELPESVFRVLRDGGFLVPRDLNERDYIKTRFNVSRMRAPARFVIAPTLDCNLSCFYCFEAKTKDKMAPNVQESVAAFVASRIKDSPCGDVTVEWYGGEPLLAPDVLRGLSGRLQSVCDEAGAGYNAAMVTNGSLLSRETIEELTGGGIRSFHVTLDGTAEFHDARRAPSSSAGGADGATFDRIVENIEAASERAQVNVRLNVGRSNRHAVGTFLRFARERKWAERGVEVYPAPIFGTSAPCMGYPDEALPEEDFEAVLDEFCEAGSGGCGASLAEVVGFPPGRHYTCEALAYNSFAVAPTGSLFKCPLEIDDESKAVGAVTRPLDLYNTNLLKWLSLDPFGAAGCRECVFLPLCFGGCPKKLFEEGERGRRSACRFWSVRFSGLLSLAARRGLGAGAAHAAGDAGRAFSADPS
jgi:uncharacterized protein